MSLFVYQSTRMPCAHRRQSRARTRVRVQARAGACACVTRACWYGYMHDSCMDARMLSDGKATCTRTQQRHILANCSRREIANMLANINSHRVLTSQHSDPGRA